MPVFCSLTTFIISIFVGAGVGFLYGFCFSSKLSIASFQPASLPLKLHFFFLFLFSLARFLFLGLFFWYVLHAPSLNIILVVTSFLVSFWTTILVKRAQAHGR